MMGRATLLKRAAALIGAAVVLTFLLVNLRSLDPVRHDHATRSLSELQALDAELGETVLKLRYGLLNNYDHLVATLQRTRQIKDALESGPWAIAGRGDSQIDAAMAALASAIDEKDGLIEQFKARNALLRNSVHYLPVSIEVAMDGARNMRNALQAVQREALLIQTGSSAGDYSAVTSAIAALARQRQNSAPAATDKLDKVLLHARHIVEHQQAMDKLIPRITSPSNELLGRDLTIAYNQSFEKDLARNNRYRFWLLLASLALLGYAAYAFIRLRQNAKKLAHSEARYRSVVAAIAEGIVIRDKTGLITACNASAERILGRSLEQMEGHASFDASWQALREDGSQFPVGEQPAFAALRTGQLQSNVVVGFRKPDNSFQWLSMSAQPLLAESDPTPTGVVTSLVDVTSRKRGQAREAMEHAVTRALAELESIPDALTKVVQTVCETQGFVCGTYYAFDEQTLAARAVATWSDGSSPDLTPVLEHARANPGSPRGRGLIGRTWTSRQPVGIVDLAQDAGFTRAALAARTGLHAALAFPVQFGNEIFGIVECFSREPRPADDLVLQSARAIGLQIGQFIQRKKAEESLHLAANAMKNTAEGIVVYDASRRIVFVNEAFTGITGYTAEEVLGKAPEFMRAGEDEADLYDRIWETVREHGRWQGEVRRRRKTGEIYPELRSISAVADKAGNITHFVAVFTDIAKFKEYEARLEFLAHHDALTRLPNRVLYHDRCNETFLRARRHGNRAALLFVDLDHFKTINDSLGHQTGDTLLQAVAERLSNCVRASDTVARAGGDEFTILLDELRDAQDAAMVAEKVLAALAQPFILAGHKLVISGSIGISVYPEDGTETDTLLKNADAAMYRAKEQGRNAYRFFSGEMNAHALDTLLLTNNLRLALERNELLLHYQPRIDLATQHMMGVEALIRWQRPDVGLVSPARFIPIAEDTGLIVPIGEWVLRTACAQLRAWQDAGLPRLQMAVNLSARQLAQPDFAGRVASILAETRIEAALLELEITESMMMQDPAGTVKVLTELSATGVALAIDDFGTGYSSLSYLKRFPIDALKIDQSFVRGLPADGDDVAITRTIVAMAKGLNLHVIAEGVETEAQLSFLLAEGCQEAQGYLFSKPVPARDLERLLRAGGDIGVEARRRRA